MFSGHKIMQMQMVLEEEDIVLIAIVFSVVHHFFLVFSTQKSNPFMLKTRISHPLIFGCDS